VPDAGRGREREGYLPSAAVVIIWRDPGVAPGLAGARLSGPPLDSGQRPA